MMKDDLIRVVVDKNEWVNTSKGPIHFSAGAVVNVEPWIASTLVGRGYAHFPSREEKLPALPDDLSSLTVAELRKLACDRSVDGYNLMRKAELLEVLGPTQVAGVGPAKSQNFEKINLIPEGTVLKEPSEAAERFDDG